MRARSRLCRPVTLTIACALGLPAVCLLGGCYQRVVGAEGIGTSTMDVHEPNLKEPQDSAWAKPQTAPSKTVPTKQARP